MELSDEFSRSEEILYVAAEVKTHRAGKTLYAQTNSSARREKSAVPTAKSYVVAKDRKCDRCHQSACCIAVTGNFCEKTGPPLRGRLRTHRRQPIASIAMMNTARMVETNAMTVLEELRTSAHTVLHVSITPHPWTEAGQGRTSAEPGICQ